MDNRYDFFEMRASFSAKSIQAGSKLLSEVTDDDIVRKILTAQYQQMPIPFFKESGSIYGDVVGTGLPSVYLVSEKLKQMFESEGFSGWTTYPIIFTDRSGHEILGFHGFSVTGTCGAFEFGDTEIVEKRLFKNSPQVRFRKGLRIEIKTWDRTDFFVPSNYDAIFCTSKVRNAFNSLGIDAMTFESCRDWEILESSLITLGLV